MKILSSVVLCSIFLLLSLHCTPPGAVQINPNKILVSYEKLIILPVSGVETFRVIEGWPSDSVQEAALWEMASKINNELITEFRRCEKYGMYTVVDSLHAPTVFIRPRLSFEAVKWDSLIITTYIDVDNRASDRQASLQIRTWGLFNDDMRDASFLHRYGQAFSTFTHFFPYRKTVSFFYP